LITRKDDCEETVRERFRIYEELTGVLIGFYRTGDYHRIDGALPPERIWSAIQAILEPVLAPAGHI
jgi:adenylate kinase